MYLEYGDISVNKWGPKLVWKVAHVLKTSPHLKRSFFCLSKKQFPAPEDILDIVLHVLQQFSIIYDLLSLSDYCPDGYSSHLIEDQYTCYKFSSTPLSWDEARADCLQTPMADLIIIENALENRYIRDIAAGAGGDDWWVGEYRYLVFHKVPFLVHVSFAVHFKIVDAMNIYNNAIGHQ